jgi:hypothetical protein
MERRYTLATKEYISQGKDGYDAFIHEDAKLLVDGEDGPILPTSVRNRFRAMKSLNGLAKSKHKALVKAGIKLMHRIIEQRAVRVGEFLATASPSTPLPPSLSGVVTTRRRAHTPPAGGKVEASLNDSFDDAENTLSTMVIEELDVYVEGRIVAAPGALTASTA